MSLQRQLVLEEPAASERARDAPSVTTPHQRFVPLALINEFSVVGIWLMMERLDRRAANQEAEETQPEIADGPVARWTVQLREDELFQSRQRSLENGALLERWYFSFQLFDHSIPALWSDFNLSWHNIAIDSVMDPSSFVLLQCSSYSGSILFNFVQQLCSVLFMLNSNLIWLDCYILRDFHPIWSRRWVVSFIRPRFWHVSCWIWTEFSLFELILFGCHVIKQSMKDSIRFSCCLLLEWCF